jgi:hypothetical protein
LQNLENAFMKEFHNYGTSIFVQKLLFEHTYLFSEVSA